MSILKIARMGHPVLLRPADAIDPAAVAGDAALQRLIDDMTETLIDSGGVGLAAPQVFEGQRVILAMAPSAADADAGDRQDRILALVNPELELIGDERALGWEGCLSIPGLRGAVPRATAARFRGLDRYGRPLEGEARGFFARILQHEVDHLDGVLYPMRMQDFRYFGFDEELNRLEREAAEAEEEEETPS